MQTNRCWSSARSLFFIAVIFAAGLMLAACGTTSGTSAGTQPAADPAPAASQPAPGSSSAGTGGTNSGSGSGSASSPGSGSSGGSGSGTAGGTPAATAAIAYVGGSNNNFYGIRVDSASNISTVAGSPYSLPGQPDSFAISGNLLFAASISSDFSSGTITAFRADSNGALSQLGSTTVKSQAGVTIALDASGKFLYAMGYTSPGPSGSQNALFGYAVDQSSGALAALPGSPWYLMGGMGGATNPKVSQNGQWVCVNMELARTNQGAQCYTRHADGSIDGSNWVQPAVSNTSICGLALTPDSSHILYTDCQQNVFSSLIASARNGNGASSGGSGAAGVDVDSGGRLAAVANSGSDTVAIFSLGTGGTLAPAGAPSSTPARPNQVAFARSGAYLFVTTRSGTEVFSVNSATGALTALNGSNLAPGTDGAVGTM